MLHRLSASACLSALAAVCLLASPVHAQSPDSFEFTSPTTTHSENFNALPADNGTGEVAWEDADSGGSPTLDHWYAEEEAGTPMIRATLGDDATEANEAHFFSFGVDAQSDRALGAISRDADSDDQAFGMRMLNSTGATIVEIRLTFTYEHWRAEDVATNVNFFWREGGTGFDLQSNAAGWNSEPRGSIALPDPMNGMPVALDGNDMANQTIVQFTICTRIDDANEFWIGWRYPDGGSAVNHGVGIDELDISIVTISDNLLVFEEDFGTGTYADASDLTDTTTNPFTQWQDVDSGATPVTSSGVLAVNLAGSGEISRPMCSDFVFSDGDGGGSTNTDLWVAWQFTVTSAMAASENAALLGLRSSVDDGYWGIVWLVTNAIGEHNLGLSLESETGPGIGATGTFTLSVGTTYFVVLHLDMAIDDDPRLSLGINPAGDGVPTANWLDDIDLPAGAPALNPEIDEISVFLPGATQGAVTFDDLNIGTTFDSITSTATITFTEDNPLPTSFSVTPGQTGVLMARFDIESTASLLTPVLNSLVLDANGSGHDFNDIDSVQLWLDDGDGAFGALTDTQIGLGQTYDADDGNLTLTVNLAISEAGETYFVIYFFDDSFSSNDTFSFDVESATITGGTNTSALPGARIATGTIPPPPPDPVSPIDDNDPAGGNEHPLRGAMLALALLIAVLTWRRRPAA